MGSVWPGCQPVSRRATVSRLVRRSVSAWALPRPSATASARLAKTTVSQSQTTMVQLKTDEWAMAVPVVSTAPTSTTNMTGFLSWTRGSSFLNASGVDFQQDLRVEQAAADPALGAAGVLARARRSLGCGGYRHQCSPSANGPSARAGK